MTSYEFLVSRGFSGWEFDDNNSSDAALNDEHVLKFVLENRNRSDSFSTLARYKSLLREDESLKNYIDPYENVKNYMTSLWGGRYIIMRLLMFV